jgi:hypothetical protein
MTEKFTHETHETDGDKQIKPLPEDSSYIESLRKEGAIIEEQLLLNKNDKNLREKWEKWHSKFLVASDNVNASKQVAPSLDKEMNLYKDVSSINDLVDRIIPIKLNNDDVSIALLADAYQDLIDRLEKIKQYNPDTWMLLSDAVQFNDHTDIPERIKEQKEMLLEIAPFVDKLNRPDTISDTKSH